MKRKYSFYQFVLFTLLFLCAGNIRAQLPPAAQEALDNGIIAAKVPDYVLAIRYFEDARKIAPDAPVIYFNLGLAESKIPGRELRAICWFAAYLAADPQSSNTASIKEQIQISKIKSQSNISHLIKNLQDAAPKTQYDVGGIGVLWAKAGDIETALKTVALGSDRYRAFTKELIVETLLKTGDLPNAVQIAGIVEEPDWKSRAFIEIIKVQIDNGDLADAESSIVEARRAADSIEDANNKSDRLKAIGETQIESGNIAGAQTTLKAAVIAADLITIPDDASRKDIYLESKTQSLAFIAKSQISAGDIEGAKQTLLMAFKYSELTSDPDERTKSQGDKILPSQAEAGDVKNALKTYQAFQKSVVLSNANTKSLFNMKYWNPQVKIVYAQIKAGDFAGASKMANEITDPSTKADLMASIAKAQAEERTKPNTSSTTTPTPTPTPQPNKAKPLPAPLTATEWIKRVSELEANYFVDLPGYLKTLPADDANKMFIELEQSVSKMIEQQNVITSALKRQPREQTK